MAMRKEEEYCQEAFAGYLRSRFGIQGACWEPEPNGEKKVPDFYLHHCGQTYAVEVTALMARYEQMEGGSLSELGVWKATERLTDEVERKAIEQGLLRGAYILTLDGPYDSFKRSRKEIKKVLMDFITSTRDVDQVPTAPKPSVTPSGQRYFLQKAGLQENIVGIVMLGDGADWGWSVAAELSSLVEGAIVSKAHKMRAVPSPWVLLMLDCDHAATAKEYASVRDKLAGPGAGVSTLDQFHSIYIIGGQGKVFPLHPPLDRGWSD